MNSIYDTAIRGPELEFKRNLGQRIPPVGSGPPNAYNRLESPSDEVPRVMLPPKRFEDARDPKFDPIRHFPWFNGLYKRREKLPALKAAFDHWKVNVLPQAESAKMFNVDERELRDYFEFVMWAVGAPQQDDRFDSNDKLFRHILTDAYKLYCHSHGHTPLRTCLSRICPMFGVTTRHVIERWEIDPRFIPNGYVK